MPSGSQLRGHNAAGRVAVDQVGSSTREASARAEGRVADAENVRTKVQEYIGAWIDLYAARGRTRAA